MFLKISIALISLSASACAFAENSMEAPRSGLYQSDSGDEYSVRTDGPSALTVTSVSQGGVCLQFWRSKEPALVDGVETLRGQSCNEGELSDTGWLAGFSEKKSTEIILFPPKTFEGGLNVRPIRLTYRSNIL